MKNIATVGAFFTILLCITPVNAKERVLEGQISEYECGDNCYLTISSGGKNYTGLCAASLCRKWNEKAEMPVKFKGRKVKIIVGEGVRYDADGNRMGKMDAFKKITLSK